MKKSRYLKHKPFNRFRLFFLFTIFAISVTYAYTDRHNLSQRLQPPAQAVVGTLNLKATTGTQLFPGSGIWNSTGVGIGTTNPNGKLHIRATTNTNFLTLQPTVAGGDGISYINFLNAAGAQYGLIYDDTTNAQMVLWPDVNDTGFLSIYTRSSGTVSEKVRVTNAGNVGIGTTGPGSKLDILGTAGGTGDMIRFTSSAGYYNAIGNYSSNEMFIQPHTYTHILRGYAYTSGGQKMTSSDTAILIDNNNIGLALDKGNVGIGLNDPGAVLEVTGNANKLGIIRMVQRVSGAAAYGLDIGLDPGTGNPVFSGIANGVVTNALSINRASGNVGIGTTNPAYKLVVSGTTSLAGPESNTSILETTADINANYLAIGVSGYWGLRQGTAHDINFDVYNSGTEKAALTILQNGNVGIGTAVPGTTLDVTGTGRFSSTLTASAGLTSGGNLTMGANNIGFTGNVTSDNTAGIYWSTVGSANTYSIYRSSGNWDAPYQQITVNWPTGIVLNPGSSYGKSYVDIQGGGLRVTSGNVGIGNVSPVSLLSVGGAGLAGAGIYGTASNYGVYGATGNIAGSTGVYGTSSSSTGYGVQGHAVNGTVGVYGYGGTYGVLGSGTSYGVQGNGNTGVYGGGSTYGVQGTSATSGGVGVRGDYVSDAGGGYGVLAVTGYSNGWGLYCSAFTGGCGGNQAWSGTSDGRLKKDIQTVTDALDKVQHLRGVTFHWKDPKNGTEQNMGFIAQEVLPIAPEVVAKDSVKGYYTMSAGQLTALLVEAIKEQEQKQIAPLLNIVDIVNKIGYFTKVMVDKIEAKVIETQKLIVNGVDVLEKLNVLSQKVSDQQKEIDDLKIQLQELKK